RSIFRRPLDSVKLPANNTDAVLMRLPCPRPDGQQEDGIAEVKLWNLVNGRERANFKIKGARDDIVRMALTDDGQTLATGSTGATLKLWDIASGRERATLQGLQDGSLSAVVFSPDGKLLV